MHRQIMWTLVLGAALVTLALLTTSTRAADISCQQLFKIHSENSDTATSITFVNGASTTRAILWLGFDGHPKDFAQLDPGQSVTLQTFLTHPWMVATGPGDCLEIVMPEAGGSMVSLFDGGQSDGEEGAQQTSCPAGTVPVPETDNCVPASSDGGGQASLPMYGRSLGGVMRSKPDMGAKKVSSLKDGERIEILADTGAAMNGYQWFKIRVKGKTGYHWGGIMCADANLGGVLQTCQ